MYVFCICLHAWVLSVYISLCVSVCVGDRKAETDSEWRTNPFGHIAESNTKCQNLINSIIIFIIFIHFLPARLNAVSLFSFLSLSRRSLFCTLIYFFPSIALTTGDMWACQSCWLTALKWPTEKRLIFSVFFFFFLLVRRCAGDAGPYQETQFIAVSLGERGCHSCWLTALRFAGCSVGISFKLLCFSFFVLSEITLPHTDVHTHITHTHTHKDAADTSAACSLFSKPFCLGLTMQVMLTDGEGSTAPLSQTVGQVQPCENIFWVSVLFLGEGLRIKKINC